MNEKAIDSSADVGLILILPISLLIILLFATWPVLLAGIVLNVSFNFWKRYQWQQWCQRVNPTFHQLIKENRGSITALDLAMKTNFSAAIAKRYIETKAAEFGAQYQDYQDRDRVYYFMTASTLGKILDDSEPSSLRQQEQIPLLSHQLFRSKDTSTFDPEQQATAPINHPFEIAQTESTQFQSEPEYQLQSEDSSKLGEVISPLLSSQNQLLQTKDTSTHSEQPVITPVQAQTEPAYLLQSELAKRLDVHSSTVYKRRDDPDFPAWSCSKDPQGIAWQFIPDTKQFCPIATKPQ